MQTMTRFHDLDIARTIFSGLPSIAVLGLGRAGAVAAGCLAAVGHKVHAVDEDPERLATLSQGRAPVDESGLNNLIDAGIDTEHLIAENSVAAAVAKSDLTLVTVDLETGPDGTIDLAPLLALTGPIGEGLRHCEDFHVVIVRTPVAMGTTLGCLVPRLEAASGLTAGTDFGIAYVPSFLRPGRAVADFREPVRTVIGTLDCRSANLVKRLFAPFDAQPNLTTIPKAEMIRRVQDLPLQPASTCTTPNARGSSRSTGTGRDAPQPVQPYWPARLGSLCAHASRTFDDEDGPAPVRGPFAATGATATMPDARAIHQRGVVQSAGDEAETMMAEVLDAAGLRIGLPSHVLDRPTPASRRLVQAN